MNSENKSDKKSKYEGRENLLLGKDEQDKLEQDFLDKGIIEKEEKNQKTVGGLKKAESGIDIEKIKGFLLSNYKYIILAALFIVLIIVLISLMGDPKRKEQSSETTTGSAIDVEISDTLEVDKYADVNALVTKYLSAWAASDVDMLSNMVSPFNAETEKSEIALNKDYIESMNNIVCYTKQGPVEDSYIVYAYYEMKFKGVDTLAPGLVNLFVFPTKDGYFIWDYKDYIVSGAEVNTLLSDVNMKYDEAIASDEKLKERVEGLAAGEPLPQEATEPPTEAATQPPTEAATEPPTEAATQPPTEAATQAADPNAIQEVNESLRATTTVNVRAGMDENSQKIGQLTASQIITRTGVSANGWSRIDYNGQTGYVKSEFLSSDLNVTDTVYVTSNINVRAGASEDSTKLGIIIPGTDYVRTGQEGAWSIIQYNGRAAYVKTEFLHVR